MQTLLVSKPPFIWTFVTSKNNFHFSCSQKTAFSFFPQVLTFFNMSHNYENLKICSSNKWISISKFIDRFIEAGRNKNKGVGSISSANGVERCVGSSGGAYMTGKKCLTKMKSLNKRLVQVHESALEAYEDWVTFMNSRGWTEDQIWRVLISGVFA